MSDAREAVFAGIRRRLGRGPLDEARRAELEARMRAPEATLIPARSQRDHAGQVALFVEMAEAAAASVQRLAGMDDVPAAVADYVREHQLPGPLVVAPSPELEALPWSGQASLRYERRAARNGDKVTIAPAFAGIAETGTLMLLSGPDSPTTLNFLPDAHIVVL
ncbi:MAG: LUD domain-containing protein, partial [Candidatus Competibacterales bacterium]|nr:LUD domain-containing protein [Candidatus Competibacterales bacterium]